MIDLERASATKKVRYTRLESWTIDGYEVAWLQFDGTRQDGSTFSGKELYCECDFAERNAPLTICEHKKAVRERFCEEAKRLYGEVWNRIGPKEAILDIFKRVRAEERLFEHHHEVIYIQEVAALLGVSERSVWALCDELFAEEKLNLNGAILIPYVSRFRFPKELRSLMAFMIEEPLGWPNGEAGDCFLETIEGAIHKHTCYKHGKQVFWEENYPHIAPRNLLQFGLSWVAMAIIRAELNIDARQEIRSTFRLSKIIEELESLAKRLKRIEPG